MATGTPIQYSDIISPEVQRQLDELNKTVSKLTEELEKLNKVTEKEESTAEDYNDTLRDQVEITEDLLQLTRQERELKDNLKKIEDAHKEAKKSKLEIDDKELVTLKKGKEELRKHGFEVKNATKLALAQKGSMTELSLELAKNRMRYRELTKAQRENSKIGGALLKTIQKQDKAIKKLDASIGNHQRNVGNYTSALSSMGGTFGMVGTQITQVTNIFTTLGTSLKTATAATTMTSRAMKILKVALISTGIGAIVVALGSLVAYLTDAASGTSKLAKAMAPLKAVLTTITSIAKQFGEAIALFVEGEWDEGFKLLKDSVSGASDEYQRHLAIQKSIAELELQLHERRKASILSLQQMETEQRRLLAVAKDSEVSLQNRYDAQLQAIELERSIAKERQAISALEVAIMAQKSQLSEDSREDEIALEKARAAHDAILTDLNKRMATYNAYVESLSNKLKAATKDQIAFNSSISKMEARMPENISLAQDYTAEIKQQGEVAVLSAESQISSVDDVTGVLQQAASVGSSLAEDNKELQMATALINTFAGVAMAISSAPPPFNIISAGLVLAAGLANLTQMQNVNVPAYAEGTENVPNDGLAMIHKNERILPATINRHLTGIDNVDIPNVISLGLQMPQLTTGINDMIRKQSQTNTLLSRFAYVDSNGNIFYLNGDKKTYV